MSDHLKQTLYIVKGERYGTIVCSGLGLRLYLSNEVSSLFELMMIAQRTFRDELERMGIKDEPSRTEIGFPLVNCLIHNQEDSYGKKL